MIYKTIPIIFIILLITGCGSDPENSKGDSTKKTPPTQLDETFNTTGFNLFNSTYNTNDEAVATLIDSLDRVILVGKVKNSFGNIDIIILRYTSVGVLDTTFNSVGYVLQDTGAGALAGDEVPVSALLDGSENILIAGYSDNSLGNKDMTLWRFTSAGVLDTSFDSDGILYHDGAAGGSNSDDEGMGLFIDSLNFIYVSGASTNLSNNKDMTIWKYSSTGSLDTNFSSDGIYSHGACAGGAGEDESAQALYLNTSKEIYLIGNAKDSTSNQNVCVWKLSTTGSLDTSFDTDGILVLKDIAGGLSVEDQANDIIIDSENKIYITGHSKTTQANVDMYIVKLNATSSFDTTFDSDGILTHANAAGNPTSQDQGISFAIDNLDNIYVTGTSQNDFGNTDIVIWKFDKNGITDKSFNSIGYVVHDSPAETYLNDIPNSIALDSNKKIIVSGTTQNYSHYDLFVARYDN